MKHTYFFFFWPYATDPKKIQDLEIIFFSTKICTSKDFSKLKSFEHLSGYAMSRRKTKPTKWSDSEDQMPVFDDLIIG